MPRLGTRRPAAVHRLDRYLNRTCRVYRYIGTSPTTSEWTQVATVRANIQPLDGQLMMSDPGYIEIVSHRMYTNYQVLPPSPNDPRGGFIVRPRDQVITDEGDMFMVQFVGDVAGQHTLLRVDLQQPGGETTARIAGIQSGRFGQRPGRA